MYNDRAVLFNTKTSNLCLILKLLILVLFAVIEQFLRKLQPIN